MNRTPPESVRRQLRAEVGFGCPVPGCDNPYLTYHHFDPPWSQRQHHQPEGMIALCRTHHDKADAGAFTIDQLHALKNAPHRPVAGRFDWLRRTLIAVAGGNLYFETPILVQYLNAPVIWFERDSDGHLLLSIRMLSQTREPRIQLDRNDWLMVGDPTDFVCPPHGRSIQAVFGNGDALSLEFSEVLDVQSFLKRHDHFQEWQLGQLSFPSTVVEIQMSVGGTNLRLGPRNSTFGGLVMQGCVVAHCQVGLSLG